MHHGIFHNDSQLDSILKAVRQGDFSVPDVEIGIGDAYWRVRHFDMGKNGPVAAYDSGWTKNVICDRAHILQAELALSADGLKYMAVGSGDASWDTGNNLPSPSPDATQLHNEIDRIALDSKQYLEANNTPTVRQTNRIQCTALFPAGRATGFHREFGLFGGSAATLTENSGIMFNYETHTGDEKEATQIAFLQVRIRFG